MFKRPHYIAFGLVVLLVLVLLNLPSHTSARLKLAISSLFLPLFGLAGATQQVAGTVGNAVVPHSVLLRENETLHRENEKLRMEAMQAQETAKENARLRQLLGWQQKVPWKLRLAKVVLRDPANWWRTVEIDLGSHNGMRNNLPVLTPYGLVGRIASVSLTHAQVVLLGDPNCRVAALVENTTRDTGIINVSGPFDGSLVTMSYLPSSSNVKPGETVVTSGLGGIFPKGIPIGKIVDAEPVDYGLYQEARVKLNANLSALEEVWVLFP